MRSKKKTQKPKEDSDEYEFEVDAEAAVSDEDDTVEKPQKRYNKYAKKAQKGKASATKLSQTSHMTGNSHIPQSQFSTKSPMGKRTFNQITQDYPEDAQLWIEKYAPQTMSELAVNKQKVDEFKRLVDAS